MSRIVNNGFNGRNKYLKLGILGIPFEKGQPKLGTWDAPSAIRNAGLLERIQSGTKEADIKDYGDVLYETKETLKKIQVPNMKNYADFCYCNRNVSKSVKKIIEDGRICLSLGGDHAIGLGTVHGHLEAKNDVCVLWIDAHADINTNKTSESGNTHGMPLALLVNELQSAWPSPLPHMNWLTKTIPAKSVAYIGLRSVDLYERLMIDKHGISAYDMSDVRKHGIQEIVERALNNIDPLGTKSIHVSFDIDSLDPSEAPSTGTSVDGGLAINEAVYIMETVKNTRRLNALDIVEVNPTLGTAKDVDRTVEAALDIIVAGIGDKDVGSVYQLMRQMINDM